MKEGVLSKLLTFVTKDPILDTAGTLDPSISKAGRVEQDTYGKQTFLRLT